MLLNSSKISLMRVKVKAQDDNDTSHAVATRSQDRPGSSTSPTPPQLMPKRPTVVVLTRDASLQRLVSGICGSPWAVESSADPSPGRNFVLDHNVRMVVIDDEVVPAPERGWLCTQVNKLAPDAALIYVASQHSAEVEKTARAHGAIYYTAKPLDAARLSTMLQAWLKRPLD